MVASSAAISSLDSSLGDSPDAEGTQFLGSLREAVAALLNLVHLLASPSIGPRELSALFEELQRNCARWHGEARSVPGFAPVGSLFEELERVARAAVESSHRAKARLEIEQEFRRLAAHGQQLLTRFEQTAPDFS